MNIIININPLGIEIAVDEFTTGYASLTWPKRLSVDKLKINQVFNSKIHEDDGFVAFVRSEITLANSLNMSLIAEGVEKQEQADFL